MAKAPHGIREFDERYRPCPGRALVCRADLGGDGPGPAFQALTRRPKRLAAIPTDPGFAHRVGETAAEIIGGTAQGAWRMDTASWIPEGSLKDRGWMSPWPLPNVWVGTSIESDDYAWRADELRRAPAAIRFLL